KSNKMFIKYFFITYYFDFCLKKIATSYGSRLELMSVRGKLANFKSPKVKALRSKAFTFGL
ncbi:MAG: hypothetical protein ACK5HI_07385, partial [Pseudanabaena sp.]